MIQDTYLIPQKYTAADQDVDPPDQTFTVRSPPRGVHSEREPVVVVDVAFKALSRVPPHPNLSDLCTTLDYRIKALRGTGGERERGKGPFSGGFLLSRPSQNQPRNRGGKEKGGKGER